MRPADRHTGPAPGLNPLLGDPAASYPLKAVLLVWADRDPVDVARDAALLAAVMERRADAALGAAL